MKRRNILKNEEAVSPVIATILMVAITVVLAATLYMMLPGAEDAGTPVAGSLSHSTTHSSAGEAVFSITLSTPSEPSLDTVTIRVFDGDGERVDDDMVDNYDGETLTTDDLFVHRVSEDDYIASGDRVRLNHEYWDLAEDYDFSGWEVIITFSGYSGEISDTV